MLSVLTWIVILEWFTLITDPQALGWWCHGTEVSGPHHQAGEGESQGAGPENWLNNENSITRTLKVACFFGVLIKVLALK